ncbi:peptidylprolyl isomerase [Lyngbya confervoides]|uniref:peptidylprolyl isomerase n=1 Tax=Lyngbya confervoides BDU141951 TaxID=1574623 RepID=A0ABD4T5Y7_9CYAN|nr:peptidylprolyl isomerase [Lyngbya confervoides]MCM1983848.1 peptidylprolyl isomerase [Lyngbya confervoides BDU141951]
MTRQYKIGQRVFSSELIIPLLQQYQLLPQFLRECLIEQALEDIDLSAEEEQQAVQEFCLQNQLEDPQAQQRWRDHYGMTPNQLKALALRTFRLQRFKQQTWGAKVESLFLKEKEKFDQVVYSLVRTDSSEIAQELFFRLQEQEQGFSEVAATYSKGPEAQTGGLIGPVEVTKLHPKLAQVLLSSEPGKIRPPLRIDQWIVLVKLERLLPATLDDGLRERLVEQQFQDWLRLQMEQTQLEVIDPSQAAVV